MTNWFVYIIHCTDESLYTGITTDIEKRFIAHTLHLGAKYFRGRKPRQLVYLESGHDRSSATKREMEIKKLKRVDKIKLISAIENQIDKKDKINCS